MYILPFLDNAEHYKNINQETTNVFYYIVAKVVSQGYLAVDSFLVMKYINMFYVCSFLSIILLNVLYYIKKWTFDKLYWTQICIPWEIQVQPAVFDQVLSTQIYQVCMGISLPDSIMRTNPLYECYFVFL